MTLAQVLLVITKRIILILALAFLAVIISGFISWFVQKDIYQASSTIIVSNQKTENVNNQLTYSDYNLNIQLVNSYRVLCKTKKVLDQVITALKLPITDAQLASKISVTSENQTDIIQLSVTDQNPVLAQQITNTLVSVFEREVINIMKMDNVQIIDVAPLPVVPIAPNRMQNLVLGFFIGAVTGILLAFLFEYLDRSVRTSEQIEEILNIPMLGMVPHISKNKG